jgi:hypothetical protein
VPRENLCENFKANLGREDIFNATFKYEILCEVLNDNGSRVVNFATSENLIFMSTMFPHRSIPKYVWNSPDGKMYNHMLYVLIYKSQIQT